VVALTAHAGPGLVLVRHGETAWSKAGRHTGRTDLPLTVTGHRQARALAVTLAAEAFDGVFTSPLLRARQTAADAGFVAACQDARLAEWDYGEYEGCTTREIHAMRPGWVLWHDGAPGGESPSGVEQRVAEFAATLRAGGYQRVLVFGHGHALRVLAAVWVGLGVAAGRVLALAPASICVLGHEHDQPVITRWNTPAGS
jgi:broad specificity phosphatase PhoE